MNTSDEQMPGEIETLLPWHAAGTLWLILGLF